MMQQYLALKARAGEALLLYRMGDFYELFLEDAELAAPLLDVVLTTRDRNTHEPVPMCGVPFHSVESYVRKLLAAGHSVAIADQIEEASSAKGLVRREIVEVVTPGLVANPDRLEGSAANYIAALLGEEGSWGLAYLDLSTGEFRATESQHESLIEAELARVAPREVVLRDSQKELGIDGPQRRVPDEDFDPQLVMDRVGRLPDGLPTDDPDLAARAAAALWATVARLQPFALEPLRQLRRYALGERLVLDPTTRRHLELVRNLQDGSSRATLLEHLDRTRTAMGRRHLIDWIQEPLLDPAAIGRRQERIAAWLEPDRRRRALGEALRSVGDLERSITRATLPSAGPQALASLRDSLRGAERVRALHVLRDDVSPLLERLSRTLVDRPPPPPRGEPHTGYIRDGIDAELDRVRAEGQEGRDYLATLEERERERTGIPTLRVRYNRVFGYALEVTKPQLAKIPAHYRRKQTTANAERFVTDELERWQGIVFSTREKAAALEGRVLETLRREVVAQSSPLRSLAAELAELDVLQALAGVAREGDYVRPELDDSLRIEIEAGRHPVVEAHTPDGFVPNDLTLDPADARLIILTGPNMAGKSTLLRQTALIVLLAQMGSLVPARRARIGRVDRIFTRVGAQDSLVTGESTFMVEMRETAAILREATPRSLLLLDEIGRGTSTFDGLSIAWAVAEYLHDTPGLQARTLFATHYHELADLAQTKPHVRNFHFRCAERGGEILFLRRMEPGAASRSYGIEVARHAGLPPDVIRRAREVLRNLEGGEFDERGRPRLAREAGSGSSAQLGLFEPSAPDPLRTAIRELEPERMTPIDALVELSRLRKQVEEET